MPQIDDSVFLLLSDFPFQGDPLESDPPVDTTEQQLMGGTENAGLTICNLQIKQILNTRHWKLHVLGWLIQWDAE